MYCGTIRKKRFQISEDGLRIRAVQGHSNDVVKITYPEQEPPIVLYHGTAIQSLQSIAEKGLIPQGRQHVHLSADIGTAFNVGKRHGAPAVLTVHAYRMYVIGYKFYQAENGVWLTAEAPSQFLTEVIGNLKDLVTSPNPIRERGQLL